MRVLIADDEPLSLQLLRGLLDQTPGVEVVGAASDAAAMLAAATRLRPDLVLMDIEMPGLTGLQAAPELAKLGPEIIFVTAHDRYAVQAFEAEAVDYVLKPLGLDRLRQAVDRARRRRAAREGAATRPEPPTTLPPVIASEDAASDFWVPGRAGLTRVPITNIRWIEAAKDHVFLHTTGRSHMIRVTMTSLEARLEGTGLSRVHRSAFVRLSLVSSISRRLKCVYLILDCGTEVPVGSHYAEEIIADLGGHVRKGW